MDASFQFKSHTYDAWLKPKRFHKGTKMIFLYYFSFDKPFFYELFRIVW